MNNIPVKLPEGTRTDLLTSAENYAEVRIGELMREVPKQNTHNRAAVRPNTDVKSKTEVIADMGFTPMQVSRFETLAAHPEIVAQAKAGLLSSFVNGRTERRRVFIRAEAKKNLHLSKGKGVKGVGNLPQVKSRDILGEICL